MNGAVIDRSSAAYATARVSFNQRFDGVQPLAVLRAAVGADVRQAILWARRHGIRIRARSGGHSYAGYSTVEDGLVIDLSALDGIAVNRQAERAVIGLGALLIDVYARLGGRGRDHSCRLVPDGGAWVALPSAEASASRRASSERPRQSALDRPDRDCRRAGAHPAIERRTRTSIGPAAAGEAATSGSSRASASAFIRSLQRRTSGSNVAVGVDERGRRRLAAIRSPRRAGRPVLDLPPRHRNDQPTVQSFGQFFGSEMELTQLLAPLRDVPGGRLTTGTSTYFDLMKRGPVRNDRVQGVSSGPRGRFEEPVCRQVGYVAKPLPAAGIATLRTWLEQRQGRGGGAALLTRTAAQSTGSRRARRRSSTGASFSIQYYAAIADAAEDAAALEWLRGFSAAMRPYALAARTELHRPRPRRLGSRVLRHELPSAAAGEGQVRLRQRLPSRQSIRPQR